MSSSPAPATPTNHDESSKYHSLATIIDGLRSDSLEIRSASASKIDEISAGLGPQRTRDGKKRLDLVTMARQRSVGNIFLSKIQQFIKRWKQDAQQGDKKPHNTHNPKAW